MKSEFHWTFKSCKMFTIDVRLRFISYGFTWHMSAHISILFTDKIVEIIIKVHLYSFIIHPC